MKAGATVLGSDYGLNGAVSVRNLDPFSSMRNFSLINVSASLGDEKLCGKQLDPELPEDSKGHAWRGK